MSIMLLLSAADEHNERWIWKPAHSNSMSFLHKAVSTQNGIFVVVVFIFLSPEFYFAMFP